MRFQDRTDAGQRLAAELLHYANHTDVIVLALPRGGVPVGFQVAVSLNAPLDVFLVRKLGVPGWTELAFGAIASGGVRTLNRDIVQELGISDSEIKEVASSERLELARRERLFRGDRPPLQVQGRTVILVDDGIATGASMRVAVHALAQKLPAAIVIAVPIATRETCRALRAEVDELVCLIEPVGLLAIGDWYENFQQTSDGEVCALLAQATMEEIKTPTP